MRATPHPTIPPTSLHSTTPPAPDPVPREDPARHRRRRRTHRTVAADLAFCVAAGSVLAAAPATAAPTGALDGLGNVYHLGADPTSTSARPLAYGRADDEVFVGDWDGDGTATLAVRRGTAFLLTNDPAGGTATASTDYGSLGDTVLVGDWDGDGTDTLAVRRGNVYHLKNTLTGGPADVVVAYGQGGDRVLVGDWDGDGTDTLAVRRGNVYHLKNTLAGGPADSTVAYGQTADEVLVGDWDGDRRDTLAVRRGNVYHYSDTLAGGPASTVTAFGTVLDAAFSGDLDGDGRDEVGLRRATGPVAFPLTALGAGMCGDRATLDAAAGTVGVVDCALPHDLEVLQRVAITPSAVTTAALSAASNRACEAAFPAHTGKGARTQHDVSELTVYPRPSQYTAGMRDAVCLVWQTYKETGRHAIR